jgi:hypothetical protein
VLVGQPELRERLRHRAYRALTQRSGVAFDLAPLGRAPALRPPGIAGATRPLFATPPPCTRGCGNTTVSTSSRHKRCSREWPVALRKWTTGSLVAWRPRGILSPPSGREGRRAWVEWPMRERGRGGPQRSPPRSEARPRRLRQRTDVRRRATGAQPPEARQAAQA